MAKSTFNYNGPIGHNNPIHAGRGSRIKVVSKTTMPRHSTPPPAPAQGSNRGGPQAQMGDPLAHGFAQGRPGPQMFQGFLPVGARQTVHTHNNGLGCMQQDVNTQYLYIDPMRARAGGPPPRRASSRRSYRARSFTTQSGTNTDDYDSEEDEDEHRSESPRSPKRRRTSVHTQTETGSETSSIRVKAEEPEREDLTPPEPLRDDGDREVVRVGVTVEEVPEEEEEWQTLL